MTRLYLNFSIPEVDAAATLLRSLGTPVSEKDVADYKELEAHFKARAAAHTAKWNEATTDEEREAVRVAMGDTTEAEYEAFYTAGRTLAALRDYILFGYGRARSYLITEPSGQETDLERVHRILQAQPSPLAKPSFGFSDTALSDLKTAGLLNQLTGVSWN